MSDQRWHRWGESAGRMAEIKVAAIELARQSVTLEVHDSQGA